MSKPTIDEGKDSLLQFAKLPSEGVKKEKTLEEPPNKLVSKASAPTKRAMNALQTLKTFGEPVKKDDPFKIPEFKKKISQESKEEKPSLVQPMM